MINVPVEKIDKTAIDSLVENQIPEDRTLEYKHNLPSILGAEDKKEFLADVSSFANASGGDLIFGIKEKRDENGQHTGLPEEACGIGNVNLDSELLKWESSIRDNIDPRITGIKFQTVTGFRDGPVLVMRILKSWSAPHLVRPSWKFFSRNSRGKYQLDVREIRSAFVLSESVPERIRRFRSDRLAQIEIGDTPVLLHKGAKIIMHIVPISAFDSKPTLDIRSVSAKISDLSPMRAGDGFSSRYNLDGILHYVQPYTESKPVYTYLQFFRTGSIEGVTLLGLMATEKYIPSQLYEDEVIAWTKRCLDTLKRLDLQPPVYVMLTLTGVKHFAILDCRNMPRGLPVERDVLMLSEAVIENYEEDVGIAMRSTFDCVWQASGNPGSPYYNKDGTRFPPRLN